MNPFLEACGVDGPLGLLVEGTATREPERRLLFQPFALIGRDLQNDVILEDTQVSQRHAYLQVLGGEVFCIDLKSQAGTHWPEGPRAAGWFLPTHCLRLGNQNLRLLDRKPPFEGFSSGLDPMAAGSLEKPWVSLEFLNGRTTQSRWSMNRMLALIGTAPQCKVRLHDPAVAAIHGSLLCTPKGAWAVDLLGPGGISVNGQKVRLARLDDGDLLSIGGFVMRIRCGAASTVPVRLPPRLDYRPDAQDNGEAEHQEASSRARVPSNPLVPIAHSPALGEGHAGQALESILLPLVQQFSSMQNQMFDQFRQAMAMMFQMFGTLQKDQIDLIRQEWNRVQELTQEIQVLQVEIQKQPAVSLRPAHVEKEETAPQEDLLAGTPAGDSRNGENPGPEIHAWLCRRMVDLQGAQRGCLQKILGFLSRN